MTRLLSAMNADARFRKRLTISETVIDLLLVASANRHQPKSALWDSSLAGRGFQVGSQR